MRVDEGCLPTRADLRRHNIKEVARRLFIEHGFHATGIALIAKASGVAVQQLYRDFPAKEDIIAAIVEADCERFADLATLDAALAAEDRKGVRDWLASTTCRKDKEGDRLFLEIAAEASRNSRIAAILACVRQTMFDNISRAFAGMTGSSVVTDEHRLLAESFMIVSIGSIYTRTMHSGFVEPASRNLLSCLIDNAPGVKGQEGFCSARVDEIKRPA